MDAAQDRAEDARVAVLGTGIMGSAMARNLIAAGLPTAVWDRSPSATAPLAEAGARVAPSPRGRQRCAPGPAGSSLTGPDVAAEHQAYPGMRVSRPGGRAGLRPGEEGPGSAGQGGR
jgi:2-polyprenyl-6-methoxyphenol hydroxylase-like FAD-dependent oxidoreductase